MMFPFQDFVSNVTSPVSASEIIIVTLARVRATEVEADQLKSLFELLGSPEMFFGYYGGRQIASFRSVFWGLYGRRWVSAGFQFSTKVKVRWAETRRFVAGAIDSKRELRHSLIPRSMISFAELSYHCFQSFIRSLDRVGLGRICRSILVTDSPFLQEVVEGLARELCTIIGDYGFRTAESGDDSLVEVSRHGLRGGFLNRLTLYPFRETILEN